MSEMTCWDYSTVRYQAAGTGNLGRHWLKKLRNEKAVDIKKLAAEKLVPSGKHNKPSR
ncbi:MAG: hypothetical protein JSV99_10755 [Planctomycetota bacterium]|nr:MAG: hypothetical protein JSV99_10755 [Planctomycetota bacterium]